MELPPGVFGENLTIEGLLETDVNIGDRFRIGTAEVMATAPRLSCYKLGIKFGRPDILKKLLATRYTGFYCAVLREGEVQAGDKIKRLERDQTAVSVDEHRQDAHRSELLPERMSRSPEHAWPFLS